MPKNKSNNTIKSADKDNADNQYKNYHSDNTTTIDYTDRSLQIIDAIRKGNITQNYEVRGILPQNRDVLKKMEKVVPLAIEKIQEIIATSKNERAVLQAIEFLFNRVYGKAIQPIDLEAKVDNNTTIEIKLSGELDQWSR